MKSLYNAAVCSLALLAPAVIWAVEADRTPAPDDMPHSAGMMTHDLMLDAARIEGALRISPDGQLIAYQVKRTPANLDSAHINGESRFTADGTPKGRVGLKLYLVSARGGEAREVCDVHGDSWAGSWSPDGSQLALYSNADGAVQLWIHELANGSCRKIGSVRIKARHWAGDEPVWSRDGRFVYVPLQPRNQQPPVDPLTETANPSQQDMGRTASFYAFRTDRNPADTESAGRGATSSTAPLAAHYLWENNSDLGEIEVKSGTVRVLVPHDAESRPSVVRRSPSGRWLSYLSAPRLPSIESRSVHDLWLVPAEGGEERLIFKGQPLPQSSYYQLAYQWHPTEDWLVYLADGALWLVELSASGWESPRRLGGQLRELAEAPLAFTRDGRYVIVGIQPERMAAFGRNAKGLAAVPIDGAPAVAMNLDSSQWEFDQVLHAGTTTVWQPKPDAITVQLTGRYSGETAFMRFNLESGRGRLLWQGPPLNLSGIGANRDHRQLFARFENFDTPQNIYSFDARLVRQSRLTNVEPRLEGVRAGTLHVFETTVPQFDGTLEMVRTGVILPPGNKPGDRVPAITMFYPGDDLVRRRAAEFAGGDQIGVPSAIFTSRGYAVVYAHVLTGPGGEPGQIMNEVVDSLMPQVYRAADLGFVDINRLGLAGQSFGAFATASVLTRTNLFRAAMATNGPYDLGGAFYGEFLRINNSDTGGMLWVEQNQPRIGAHLWRDLRRVIENSPYYQADKIRTPLLIVQGVEDPGFSDAQKMYTALKRLGRSAQLALYPGSGHIIGVWPRANAIDASKRTVAFFREHLGDPLRPRVAAQSADAE